MKISVRNLTSDLGPCIHRFYDTSPLSQCGKFLIITEFPNDLKLPLSREQAAVKVVRLEDNSIVYDELTTAWDSQVGAHAQWEGGGEYFHYNILSEEGEPFSKRVNLATGDEVIRKYPVYMISPCGKFSAYPNLEKIREVQAGYSYSPKSGSSTRSMKQDKEGLFVADTLRGKKRLLFSIQDATRIISQSTRINIDRYEAYGFHVKWSPDGCKIMFIVRLKRKNTNRKHTKNYLFVVDVESGSAKLLLNAVDWDGGHHPNWTPDSRSIIMNLVEKKNNWIYISSKYIEKVARKIGVKIQLERTKLSFILISEVDGTRSRILPDHLGSGHPSISPCGRFLVTDCYLNELGVVSKKDYSLIRVFDLHHERCIGELNIYARPVFSGPNNEWRLDPHPVWSSKGDSIIVNALLEGKRTVAMIDFKVGEES